MTEKPFLLPKKMLQRLLIWCLSVASQERTDLFAEPDPVKVLKRMNSLLQVRQRNAEKIHRDRFRSEPGAGSARRIRSAVAFESNAAREVSKIV